MTRYKYIGEGEVHFPQLKLTVKKGDEFETSQSVNHPDIIIVEEQVKKRDVKKETK